MQIPAQRHFSALAVPGTALHVAAANARAKVRVRMHNRSR